MNEKRLKRILQGKIKERNPIQYISHSAGLFVTRRAIARIQKLAKAIGHELGDFEAMAEIAKHAGQAISAGLLTLTVGQVEILLPPNDALHFATLDDKVYADVEEWYPYEAA